MYLTDTRYQAFRGSHIECCQHHSLENNEWIFVDHSGQCMKQDNFHFCCLIKQPTTCHMELTLPSMLNGHKIFNPYSCSWGNVCNSSHNLLLAENMYWNKATNELQLPPNQSVALCWHTSDVTEIPRTAISWLATAANWQFPSFGTKTTGSDLKCSATCVVSRQLSFAAAVMEFNDCNSSAAWNHQDPLLASC